MMSYKKMNNRINYLIDNSITALTDMWFKKRANMISATDVPTILKFNEKSTLEELLQKKTHNVRMIDNKYTLHGKKYEDQAIKVLEKKMGINIKEVGYCQSDKIEFLGATPDGICIYDNEIHLVEIKCPLGRKINGLIPFNYYAQIQTQLFVCDIKKCFFFECEFKEIAKDLYDITPEELRGQNETDKSYWRLDESNLVLVERDEDFFNKYLHELTSFHKKLVQAKKPILKRRSRKRTRSQMEDTSEKIGKRRRGNDGNIVIEQQLAPFITKTHIRNYINNNKCDAWLSIYGNTYYSDKKVENKFSKALNKRCTELDKHYTDSLIEKCEDLGLSYKKIPKSFKYNKYLDDMTRMHMTNRVAVIINPMLYNKKTNMLSNPSYIIRNCIFNKLFDDNENTPVFSSDEEDYYCIVNKVNKNIKFIGGGELISSDAKHLHYLYRNKFDNIVLRDIQNKHIVKSFIIGNKWNFVRGGEKIEGDGNTYLGKFIHDYATNKEEIDEYITWLNDIYTHDEQFVIFTEQSYSPFLESNENTDWTDFKKSILNNQNDINLLYGIGKSKKNILNNHGIYSWKDEKLMDFLEDEDLVKQLRLPKNKVNVIKNIIKFNKKERNELIFPSELKNYQGWMDGSSMEIYTDFETINDFMSHISMIYFIGMYVKKPNGTFQYYKFFADDLSRESEKKMMKDWLNSIQSLKDEFNLDYEPPIYCWSHAEQNFITQYNKLQGTDLKINFVDILEIMKNECILVKDNIYGFSIKQVVKYMFQHKMINMNYKMDCNSGDISIVSAINYYKNNDQKEYEDLVKYNTVDCEVMYHILSYFRNHFN